MGQRGCHSLGGFPGGDRRGVRPTWVASAAASGDSTSSKPKKKAAVLSWPHTGRYGGSCGCTDSAAFALKICLALVGADWERRSKSQGDEHLEMLKNKRSTFTGYSP